MKYSRYFFALILLANALLGPITYAKEIQTVLLSENFYGQSEQIPNLKTDPLLDQTQDTSSNNREIDTSASSEEMISSTITNENGSQNTNSSNSDNEEEIPAPTKEENSEISTIDNDKSNGKESVFSQEKSVDWEYSISGSNVLLKKYIGSSTDVIIPNEINGKSVIIDRMRELFPEQVKDKITSIVILDSGSKVKYENTSFNGAFSGFTALAYVDFAGLDVSMIKSVGDMFSGCTSLVNVDGLSNWNTSNVTSMKSMFSDCTSLTNVDGLSNWNTSNVTDMANMFSDCTNLTSVDGLSNWDTSNVTTLFDTFSGCTSLTSVNLRNWNTSNVTDMTNMFSGCTSLTSVDFSNWNTSNVTSMNSMFSGCTSLTDVDSLSNWNTSNVIDIAYLFFDCTSLTDVDSLSNWNTSKIDVLTYTFSGCTNLTDVDSLSNWDTSNVTMMYGTFSSCTSLANVDSLSNWNTDSLEYLREAFSGCTSLTSVSSLSNWNTSNVYDMRSMFSGCTSLTSVDNLNNWDTSNVTTLFDTFSGCTSLISVDLSNWNTSNVYDMENVFRDCTSLTSINLSSWDTSNVTYMANMFFTNSRIDLLVVTADNSKLLAYDYNMDNRSPFLNPLFDANGGKFSDQSDTKSYFTKVAYTKAEFDDLNNMETFEQFMVENVPVKDNYKFLEWKLIKGGIPNPTQVLDLLNAEYQAQWKSLEVNIPSEEDNTKPGGDLTTFGIAYMPKEFAIKPTPLNDLGKQSIPITMNKRFDVAVRDLRNTHTNSSWRLEAQLRWESGKELTGASIQTSNIAGEVKKNENNGNDPFEESDLKSLINNEVEGKKSVNITTEAPTLIMLTSSSKIRNGVYNYNLGTVTLEIEETKNIRPDAYTGYVEWMLTNAL